MTRQTDPNDMDNNTVETDTKEMAPKGLEAKGSVVRSIPNAPDDPHRLSVSSSSSSRSQQQQLPSCSIPSSSTTTTTPPHPPSATTYNNFVLSEGSVQLCRPKINAPERSTTTTNSGSFHRRRSLQQQQPQQQQMESIDWMHGQGNQYRQRQPQEEEEEGRLRNNHDRQRRQYYNHGDSFVDKEGMNVDDEENDSDEAMVIVGEQAPVSALTAPTNMRSEGPPPPTQPSKQSPSWSKRLAKRFSQRRSNSSSMSPASQSVLGSVEEDEGTPVPVLPPPAASPSCDNDTPPPPLSREQPLTDSLPQFRPGSSSSPTAAGWKRDGETTRTFKKRLRLWIVVAVVLTVSSVIVVGVVVGLGLPRMRRGNTSNGSDSSTPGDKDENNHNNSNDTTAPFPAVPTTTVVPSHVPLPPPPPTRIPTTATTPNPTPQISVFHCPEVVWLDVFETARASNPRRFQSFFDDLRVMLRTNGILVEDDTPCTPQNMALWWVASMYTTHNSTTTTLDSVVSSYALGVLYLSLTGYQWTNQTNWMMDIHYCGWSGVECGSAANATTATTVVGLNLPKRYVYGTIPQEIALLSSLSESFLFVL